MLPIPAPDPLFFWCDVASSAFEVSIAHSSMRAESGRMLVRAVAFAYLALVNYFLPSSAIYLCRLT